MVYMTQDHRSWGDDRIVGAPVQQGHTVRAQTVSNMLKCPCIPPAPKRQATTPWKEGIRMHLAVVVATDFCTAEPWTRGIIRVRATCCSFLRSAKTQSSKTQCSVANASEGS